MQLLNSMIAMMGASILAALPVHASTIQQIKNASFELYRDGAPICSAQFVSPTELLTAAHCLAQAKDHHYAIVTAQSNGDYTVYDLAPFHINPEYDTATLKVVDPKAAFPFVDVAPAPTTIAVGSEVFLAGFPDVQGYFLITKGVLSAEVPMPPQFLIPGGQDQYVVSAWAIPGSSGSGLYYEIDGGYYLIGTEHGGPNDVMNFTSVLQGVRAVL